MTIFQATSLVYKHITSENKLFAVVFLAGTEFPVLEHILQLFELLRIDDTLGRFVGCRRIVVWAPLFEDAFNVFDLLGIDVEVANVRFLSLLAFENSLLVLLLQAELSTLHERNI